MELQKEKLHGISMTVRKGEFIALVGPSGSGKSTVARLIASLWDTDSGSVSLGGVDIKDIPLDEYNQKIAYVSQDNFLFDLTVRENIRLGNSRATDSEVEEAARKCGCHGFIMGLENGYDTVVGTSGGHLSGGEKQRISIARAIMKDSPIIILDEATANVDPKNEAELMKAIDALTEEKTIIMIAHRLKTVRNADRIFVIENGRVAEQGTHQTLMEKDGIYKSFVSSRREAASWRL